ncbi:DUF927 domain-containing protein [Catenovulum adriaticum]|uniref:DUF927 domain-containing protein n=1 Tax=Catenovulum adriaticum TaxID=2984846 RepID=A0ABY7ALZ1_9ALTE|nr:DUF927 domain-containing protein [Catenovulum sp. TS8]WAJ69747.1 DUF927 domain-containing protein [Catenovulum sp. TS8]
MQKLNFKAVNDAALARAEQVAAHYAPNGTRQGHEWLALNPTRSDNKKGSFSINLNTGVWADFSTSDKGGDFIDLVAYIENTGKGAACKRLAEFLGVNSSAGGVNNKAPAKLPANKPNTPAFIPVPPPASAANLCPTEHYQNGTPSKIWNYTNAKGVLIIRVMRFDSADGNKTYRPLAYGSKKGQAPKWHWQQLPDNRPLYNLPAVSSQCENVVLVEGEKAADAAKSLFTDYVASTWSGAVKAVAKTDFSPLASKNVLFWPDNDEAGQEIIDKLKAVLESVKVKSFNVVNLAFFSSYKPTDKGLSAGGEWPEKADAFEAVQMGFTAKHISAAIKKGVFIQPDENEAVEAIDEDQPEWMPKGFKIDDNGLYAFNPQTESYSYISKPIHVLALSRNANGDGLNWGKLVEFSDFDEQSKQWNIPNKLFNDNGGQAILKELLDRGFEFEPRRNSKKQVLEYLEASKPTKRMKLTQSRGWHDKYRAFVLHDKVLGDNKANLMFYSERPFKTDLSSKGTLEEWRENVSRYCIGNPFLTFSVSLALAAPLVELMGFETMGFHLFGDSSLGKSTSLNIGNSVYGDPKNYGRTFRGTDNGLEMLAADRNSLFLTLDEIHEADPNQLGGIVYMLGNGQEKTRAAAYGAGSSDIRKWHLAFLSSGEHTLAQRLAEIGKKATGGQAQRLIELHACLHEDETIKKKMGSLNELHNFDHGSKLAEYLSEQMRHYHGCAFPAFIEALLASDINKMQTYIAEFIKGFTDQVVSEQASGQAKRAAKKFALVAAAGVLASNFNITGWTKEQAIESAYTLFMHWLNARGGEGNMEVIEIIKHVRLQFELNGEARFTRWDEVKTMSDEPSTVIDTHVPRTSEQWGFKRSIVEKSTLDGDTLAFEYYVYPTVFEQVVCRGYDHKRVARLLKNLGALVLTDSEHKEGRLKTKTRVPGSGKKRISVYRIDGSQLSDDDELAKIAA